MRSASTATCSFSSETLVIRSPVLAWRKNVRCPGVPTVPVTNRSGGSWRWTTSAMVRAYVVCRGAARTAGAPPSAGPAPATDGGVSG